MDIIKYNSLRLKGINAKFKELPMKYFTPEDMKPSEQTLNLIRQIAYTYKVFKNSGKPQVYCLN